MPIEGFFGGLAASASIFVGILTTILVNDIVRKQENKSRKINRMDNITTRLNGLKEKKEEYEAEIAEIEEEWDKEERKASFIDVDRFISSGLETSFSRPAEILEIYHLTRALAEYYGVEEDELTNYHRERIKSRFDEIKERMRELAVSNYTDEVYESNTQISFDNFVNRYKDKWSLSEIEDETEYLLERYFEDRINISEIERIARDRQSTTPLLDPDRFSSSPTSEVIAVKQAQKRYHEKDQRFDVSQNLQEVNTEIKTLEEEKEDLEEDLSSIDIEDTRRLLKCNIITILFSVVFPIIAYWAIASRSGLLRGIESPTSLFILFMWAIGLSIVFGTIWDRIEGIPSSV